MLSGWGVHVLSLVVICERKSGVPDVSRYFWYFCQRLLLH